MNASAAIESIFSLIQRSSQAPARPRTVTAGSRIVLPAGQSMRLAGGRYVVLAGRVWLTHRGDARDHFPGTGDSFDTSPESASVVEAMAECTLFYQPD